jgi:hypothetical protein
MTYKDLPDTITTNEELYALTIRVVGNLRSATTNTRMTAKGMTHMDVANDLFLRYLQGLEPKTRRPVIKGKLTSPTMKLAPPVKKRIAYGIITRDALNYISSVTREEHQRVQLVAFDESMSTERYPHD